TREARHLLNAEGRRNLNLRLGSTTEQQSPQRRILEPELHTLGYTVFPRRADECFAVRKREPLALCMAQKNLGFGGRPSPEERTQFLHDRVLLQLLQLVADPRANLE